MPTPKKTFISYSHKQKDWVRDCLVPVLRASGVDVLFDERFRLGKDVRGEMERLQKQASRHVLCLSDDYLASSPCKQEMNYALKADPDNKGIALPIRLLGVDVPKHLQARIYADLSDDRQAEPWRKLLDACDGDFGTGCAVRWLNARDEVRQLLERGKSICLHVTSNQPRWSELFDDVLARASSPPRVVDLDAGNTKTRTSLIDAILDRSVPSAQHQKMTDDLTDLHNSIRTMSNPLVVKMVHFSQISKVLKDDDDLFGALRHLIMDERKLILLIQSRVPVGSCLPTQLQQSQFVQALTTVELS